MASVIEPPADTTPPAPRPEASDAALARRATAAAAVGWLAVAACVAGRLASAEYRELLGCAAVVLFFAAYRATALAVIFSSRSSTASRTVLFLEAMRRRLTDEPRLDVVPPRRSVSH